MATRRLTITIEWGRVKPTKQPKASESATRVDTVTGRTAHAAKRRGAGFRAPASPRSSDERGA